MLMAPDPRTLPVVWHNGKALCIEPRGIRSYVKGHHKDQILHKSDYNGNPLKTYHLYSHTADEVSRAIQYFLPNVITKNQRDGIHREALDVYKQMRYEIVQDPENPDRLLKYLYVFDKLFFFGALKNFCCIVMVKEPYDRLGDATSHRNAGFVTFDSAFEIRIRILIDGPERAPQDRLRTYLSVLLHEAVHAIFDLYVCWECPDCRADHERDVGRYGHGPLWARSARLIEAAAKDLGMGPLNLLVDTSLAWDRQKMAGDGMIERDEMLAREMQEQISWRNRPFRRN